MGRIMYMAFYARSFLREDRYTIWRWRRQQVTDAAFNIVTFTNDRNALACDAMWF